METQKILNTQSKLEKEWKWMNLPSWLKIILQSYSHQDSMVLAQKQKYKPMEQDRKPRNKPITLPTKVLLVKAMVFPVIMYGWESWTIKKAERWRIYAFELWCGKRLLRVPWTARRSNQEEILKEISPEYSLEGLMLKLKFQYFGHLMQKTDHWKRPWFWEGLKTGGEGYNRGWDGWMASPTRWIWVWVDSRSWWWTGSPGVLRFMGLQRVRHDWATELTLHIS